MTRLLIALPLAAFCATAVAGGSDAMPPYTLDPGPHAGNWEATLTGSGLSDDSFDDADLGLTGSLGYYFNKNFIVTFKQGAAINSEDDSTLVNARSTIQAAYQWDLAKWQPYVGLNVGAIYGAGVSDDWLFGPEAGIKYFVNESTFLFGNISYEIPIDECCNDGVIPYGVGIGFDF